MSIWLEGFILQASLILVLGAQNLFVLECGLKRRSPFAVAAVCTICDGLLLIFGVAGAASLFASQPWLKIGFGVLGVLFLLYYAILKLMEGLGFREMESLEVNSSGENTSSSNVLWLALAFSLLNPHVYLDIIVLIGGYAAKFEDVSQRLSFGTGAASFSVIWFFSLAFFSKVFGAWLNSEVAMKRVALISGLVLGALALSLSQDVYIWIKEF